MKVYCASCNKRFSAQLKRQIVRCSHCDRQVSVNPERPFTKIWFLFLVAMPFVAAYSQFSASGWSLDVVGAFGFLLAIPLAIFFFSMYFSGTETPDMTKVTPTLVAPEAAVRVEFVSPPTKPKASTTITGVVFISAFLAWGLFYIFYLRPMMNIWLAQFISGYPAMLHLVPLVGLPVLMAIGVGKLLGSGKKDAA